MASRVNSAEASTDTSPAATLTEWLRRRSDAQLSQLLLRRPDLSLPAPTDLATLANRLGVRSSVQRAVDQLDAFTLRVLESAVLGAVDAGESPQTSLEAVEELLGGAGAGDAVTNLLELGLLWGDHEQLHVLGSVADAVGPFPAGLGRPYATLVRSTAEPLVAPVLQALDAGSALRLDEAIRRLSDVARIASTIAGCGPAEREILSRLAQGPPVGVVRDAFAATQASQAASPPHQLIRLGLLVPIDLQTVELPREVGLVLRGGHVTSELRRQPAPLEVTVRTASDVDKLAGTAVLESLRLVEKLAANWATHPPAVLRSGGIGARELRRTARDLDVTERVAALLAEVAAAAGLVATTQAMNPVYLPTSEYDHWLAAQPANRWYSLAASWLGMTRQPSLVNERDDRERLISVLGPDVERGTVLAVRRSVLGVLADLAPGEAPVDRTQVLGRLAWVAPRRAVGQRPIAEAVLEEAELLGLTGAGALTRYGRGVLDVDPVTTVTRLTDALPAPLNEFLLQPDLTVVVPGPPTPELARQLAETADLESSGGASVYRLTESTLRRALDVGWTSGELATFFTRTSRTPVPQALSYLIDDITRRHGVLRTGATTSYLRCDDESLLTRVLLDPALSTLELRRLAPTVLISSAAVNLVLEKLRGAGLAPSPEAADGAVVAFTAQPARAPARPGRGSRVRTTPVSAAHTQELVRRLRAGDTLAEVTRRVQPTGQRIPGVTTAATLELLRNAIRNDTTIWLGYVDTHGTSSQHTIVPISMAGGTLRGHDTATGLLEAFALHHITAVSLVEP